MTSIEIIGCASVFYALTLFSMLRLVRVAENLEAYKSKAAVTISRLENEVVTLKGRVERVERDAVSSWKRLDELSDFEANQITESLRKVGTDGLTDVERMYRAIDEDF